MWNINSVRYEWVKSPPPPPPPLLLYKGLHSRRYSNMLISEFSSVMLFRELLRLLNLIFMQYTTSYHSLWGYEDTCINQNVLFSFAQRWLSLLSYRFSTFAVTTWLLRPPPNDCHPSTNNIHDKKKLKRMGEAAITTHLWTLPVPRSGALWGSASHSSVARLRWLRWGG